MPDTDEPKGLAAVLQRFDAAIEGIDSQDAPAPEATPAPEPEAKTPEPELEDLAPTKDQEPSAEDSDLDSLDGSEPKEPAAKTDAKTDAKSDAPSAEGDDLLDTFDEDDRAKIQAYIDAKVAAEVTETESAGGAFKRIKAENRDLQAQLREARAGAADSDALKAAEARIAELEEAVKVNEQTGAVTNLEATQAYQDAVVKPQQAILAESDKIAERYGADRDELARILGNTERRDLPQKITEILGEDVAETDKLDLYDLSRRAEATFAKQKELHENAEEALKEAEALAEKAKEREALEGRQARKQAGVETIERIKAKAKFLADYAGEETLEAALADIEERSVDALSPSDQAYARVAAKMLVPLAKKLRALESELQDANDELVARRKAAPGSKGGVAPAGEERGEDAPDEYGVKSLAARIDQQLANI